MTARIGPSQATLVNRLNTLGYIPIVGTVSGTCRIVYGVGKAVLSAIAALFSIVITGSDKNFGAYFCDGVLHIIRGSIECVPITGGLVTFFYDRMNADYSRAPHRLF